MTSDESSTDSTRNASLITRHPQALIHTALLAVAILFSLNYIISKLAMGHFAPLSFAWLRVAGSAIVLNLILGRSRTHWSRRDSFHVAGFAILGVVINQTLFLSGLALTSAHVAAILITTIPVFALAAAMMLGHERGTAAKVGGIALAGAGALLVVGGEGFFEGVNSVVGALMLVGNCLAYALYLVLSKPAVERLSPTRVIARMFAVGSVLMFPISAVSLWREEWRTIPLSAWIGLALVIAGPTVAAYLLSAWALRYAESSLVAAYTYVQPVLTTILAAIFLGEHLKSIVAVAAVLIFAGVWLAGRRTI
ncbi:MAG: DMT family transporter [Thermoanaerobaculia bacterium]|nr:DMT family transporter [Thermoanaerobaculia bacterium]